MSDFTSKTSIQTKVARLCDKRGGGGERDTILRKSNLPVGTLFAVSLALFSRARAPARARARPRAPARARARSLSLTNCSRGADQICQCGLCNRSLSLSLKKRKEAESHIAQIEATGATRRRCPSGGVVAHMEADRHKVTLRWAQRLSRDVTPQYESAPPLD